MDRDGTTLGGRYRLGAKIGTGGMSDVYAATDELLGRDVAVKMMRPDLARDTSFLERFRREAQNAAKLNHPAIVAVYDTGQTDPAEGSVPYIVMERVRGETLRDIVQDYGKMNLADAASVISRVADALHFSHEAGIIHRDIKPANIMITNTGAVKVMDFGIARALSDSSAAMTQTAAVIGTAQYLSPEQARGKSADSRSDIYATGCVFYELVTGRPPFEGESPFSVAFQHVQDEPPRPSQIPGMHLADREALSLDSIIMHAMAKNPADRYDDAAQLSTDLRRLADAQLPLVAQAYTEPRTEVFESSPRRGAGDGAPGPYAPAAAAIPNPAGQRAPHGRGHYAEPSDEGERKPQGGYVATPPEQGEAQNNRPAQRGDHRAAPRPRRSRLASILWSLVALLLLGGVAFGAYEVFGNGQDATPNQQVSIPNVENLPRAEAEKRMRNAGLEFDVTERAHESIPRGNSIGTEPAVGSSVPSNTRVTLLISSGKEITEVPDLSGMTTEQAANALQAAGLGLNQRVQEEPNSTIPAGQVITQAPAQGSQVSRGTQVMITVSTGPENIRVPVVTGQTLDNARSNLEAAGFSVNVVQVDSAEPEGRVLQAAQQGTQQPRGTEIRLEVSRGNMFTMPNLVGKNYNDVYGELQRAGWRGSPGQLTRTNANTPDLGQLDRVVAQTPRAGESIRRDASIEVKANVFSLLP
ncbi:Stk1 family PASTA domain-containing Ser/Thr kinase [Corynebacterium heidelbergense]|uniref:non-specific serine/threonine protein kinase n=1 Tax=Corynebacterium heidelbergense TaxID=2055947 RepID=A0A364VB95_9CORY|nr:Stk1 family PASTA domain-containing Ser/Thr kinase [Corynebacterium heidelbergense]RAV33933.1 serine/threonine protein kinase [Corynebacterium heidelbergense]WCZ35614.1 Serine/threonine-protein kinase PknB [Corynebacterium heidelbergense]